jgi:hypothetical protein
MEPLLPIPPAFDDDRYLQRIEQSYVQMPEPPEDGTPESLAKGYEWAQAWPGVRVYAAIIQSAPFRGTDPGHIWGETRDGTRSQFLCRDRPRLLFTLAMALLEDREITLARKTGTREMQQRTVDALTHLLALCQHFVYLRNERALSKATKAMTSYRRTETLLEALDLLVSVTSALGPDEYASYYEDILSQRRPVTLFARMRAAFNTYGPRKTERNAVRAQFTGGARDTAIAEILLHCGCETGDTKTVVARLWGRERRTRNRVTRPRTRGKRTRAAVRA